MEIVTSCFDACFTPQPIGGHFLQFVLGYVTYLLSEYLNRGFRHPYLLSESAKGLLRDLL